MEEEATHRSHPARGVTLHGSLLIRGVIAPGAK
jgi:hypothetical protein